MSIFPFMTGEHWFLFVVALLVIIFGFRLGWWAALFAKMNANKQAPIAVPADSPKRMMPSDENMAQMAPMQPSVMSELRAMRRQLESLASSPKQDEDPKLDPARPLADDAHLALELALRRPDQHESLTKVSADLIKQAAEVGVKS